MTCDNLLSADVVTADGRLLNVSATVHPDLFWALKGGGGNFGIVTSFEFRLHRLGPLVAFAGPVYAMDKARTILRRFADFASSAPDEVNVVAVLWSIPGGSAFPQHLHGREVLIVSGTYAGTPDGGHDVLRPLREFDEPVLGNDETPFGTRSAPFLLEVVGSWSEAAHSEQNLVWVRHVFETMHSFSGRINPNFSGAGEDSERFVRAAFGDHYQRLAGVKHAYDPTNMFRLNQNIAVAAG
jgi:FAD/FMN-containing dehydrogenase